MTATTEPTNRRRVAMLVSNPTTSPVTGWPIGFWWAELTHPWWTFHEAGFEIDFVSLDGGRVEGDAFSDPRHESGYSADDLLSLGFASSPAHADLLQTTLPIRELEIASYDALFVVGGQGPMVTMRSNPVIHDLVRGFYESGKVVALVCHGTCVLLEIRLSDGSLLVEGKTWTGFADSEERLAEDAAGQSLQPFWIETEARRLEGTNFVVHGPFTPFAVRDGLLITGQQQHSGVAAARHVIEALGH